MSRKPSTPLTIAPLQCVIAEEITDPAEQAAIDKMRQRLKRKQGGRKAKTKGGDGGTAAKSAAKKRG